MIHLPEQYMAKRRRLFKVVNVATKDMGSAGGQILIGKVSKLDAQGINGYLNNIRLSVLLNDSVDGEIGGFMAYLTTSSSWDDDYVITARGGSFGDTISLSAKRTIQANSIQATSNTGQVYLWVELTDITVATDVELRYVAETWGSFIGYTEE